MLKFSNFSFSLFVSNVLSFLFGYEASSAPLLSLVCVLLDWMFVETSGCEIANYILSCRLECFFFLQLNVLRFWLSKLCVVCLVVVLAGWYDFFFGEQ